MKTDPDKFFQMRVNSAFEEDLDELRRLEFDLPTRAEMIRRLVQRARAESAIKDRRRK